jgi:hypothetical protein
VITEVGPIEINVLRDRDASFEPVMVRKGQRRLDGIEPLVLSLSAKGLTYFTGLVYPQVVGCPDHERTAYTRAAAFSPPTPIGGGSPASSLFVPAAALADPEP